MSDESRRPKITITGPTVFRSYGPELVGGHERKVIHVDPNHEASSPRLAQGQTLGDIAKTTFAGVPLDRFCARCSEMIGDAVAKGMAGVAGLCEQCRALVDAATPAAPGPEHPAPWRWVDEGNLSWRLEDAAGKAVAAACNTGELLVPDPMARELIRLAPEMEVLVRDLYRTEEGCMDCGAFDKDPHEDDCRIGPILAALDAARKAP